MAKLTIRTDLCTGCLNCQTVCALLHAGRQDRSASAIRVELEIFSGLNSITFCRQCENPECLKACPVNAIFRDKNTGAWKINCDICVKCGSCVAACPFGAMSSSGAGKAYPVWWHGQRSVMKDSLTVEDQVFPRIYSRKTEDNFARAGNMEGPSFEKHMFASLTGIPWIDKDMEHASKRVIQLERALLVRNFNRSRTDDESVIPYYEMTEQQTNPLIGHQIALDSRKFKTVMDEYYTLRGWDKKTGRPTAETLKKFGLEKEAEKIGDKIVEKD